MNKRQHDRMLERGTKHIRLRRGGKEKEIPIENERHGRVGCGKEVRANHSAS